MSNLYYRGDSIFLYVKFVDESGNPISVVNPMVDILHESPNGEIIKDAEAQDLLQLGLNEYYINYSLNSNADYGTYEVIYSANYGDKVARIAKEFHVIPRSEIYENVVKIYGYVNNLRLGNPLISATIKVNSTDSSEIVSQTFTKEDGYWDVYLYPGEYTFQFSKYGFISQEITVQIGLEHNEIQFNNIALETENTTSNGNGIYLVKDQFITKEGTPLNGLNVQCFNVVNPTLLIAEDNTDDEGEYKLFLDPGIYLLKINGTSLGENFNQTFQVKVEDDGKTSFENLTSNIAIPTAEEYIGQGIGAITVSDKVIDGKGNPVIDVQVNVFISANQNNILAQDYTDPSGAWEVHLDPGTYVFEFYHPDFNVITETRVIS